MVNKSRTVKNREYMSPNIIFCEQGVTNRGRKGPFSIQKYPYRLLQTGCLCHRFYGEICKPENFVKSHTWKSFLLRVFLGSPFMKKMKFENL